MSECFQSMYVLDILAYYAILKLQSLNIELFCGSTAQFVDGLSRDLAHTIANCRGEDQPVNRRSLFCVTIVYRYD